MNRSEYISILSKLAAPIAPNETRESRDEQINCWHKTLNINSIDVLLDLLIFPPTEKEIGDIEYEFYENYDPEIFEAVLTQEILEALTILGKKDVSYFLHKIKSILNIRRLRDSAIYIIGLLQNEEGIALLETLLELENLSDDEIINLACALGGIGGLKSFEILGKMKVKFSDRSPDVLKEIELGIEHTNKNNNDKK